MHKKLPTVNKSPLATKRDNHKNQRERDEQEGDEPKREKRRERKCKGKRLYGGGERSDMEGGWWGQG